MAQLLSWHKTMRRVEEIASAAAFLANPEPVLLVVNVLKPAMSLTEIIDTICQRSNSISDSGVEQQIRTLPSMGRSSGSGE
jgi:hypothetical protein